ncbi:YadA-like family protein [Paraburkholderia terrae]|uniref:YadA-like family protein n=1 Tax=Paraburkholderia terrae TaxID=311230 RepID=UPI00296A9B35|nr:YadA-like family protein [Paraburkholderia terrae]MDW3655509.1 YadA-like family protein [Paraburkholderia terrae]
MTSGKATFYLNGNKQTTSNVMTATASNGNVLLSGLDRGAVAASSLDAINGSQLYATNQNVSNLSNVVNNLGGGNSIKYFHANSTAADSVASGGQSVAIGPNAIAGSTYAVAIGSNANVVGENSGVAVGNQSYAYQNGAAFGQSASASGASALALGNYATASGINAVAAGGGAVALTDFSVAVGELSTASGATSLALGGWATASTANSVALGSNSVANSSTLGSAGFAPGGATVSAATGFGEMSVGAAGKERRITNVAAGYAATDAVNVSQLMAEDARVNLVNNNLSNLSNVVNNIPTNASLKYFHANSTLADSTVTGVNSVAAGPAAVASANNAVALGANSVADRANTVSVGSATAQRQIVNVGAGQQAADAVNVSQLSGVTQALGGGASVKADGSIAQPTYNVYGNTYSNVGDALGNISSATGNIVESLKYIKFGPSAADSAQASVADSVAIGGAAFATGTGAVAIGTGARATFSNSVAIGYASAASAPNTFAVGGITLKRRVVNVADGTTDSDAATVGQMNLMGSDLQTQIANLSKPQATLLKSSVLLGAMSNSDPATVAQVKSVTNALGGGASVAADGSVSAPGYVVRGQTYSNVGDAVANITQSTDKIGFGPSMPGYAQAAGSNSVAIAGNAFATGANAIAIGNGARAMNLNTVAIGYGSVATVANTFSVGSAGGERRIVNVADGINDTDVATVGQVSSDIQAAINNLNLSSTPSQAALLKSAVHPEALLGATSSLTPAQLIVSGPTDKGNSIEATGTDAIAIGLATAADADYAVAVGGNARVASNSAVAIGQNVQAYGVNAVAMGSNAGATGINAIAIGNNAAGATADDSLAIGNNAQAATQGAIAIGKDVIASGTNSVALGYASDDGGLTNVVSVGNSKLQRRITNVAAGTQKTDAVNVSQLTGVTAALGGGATVNTDGSIKAPTYTVQSTTATDVGTAIAKLDGAVTGLGNNLSNVSNTVNNIVNGGGIKYFHANSALADSSASGAESVAIGGGAIASGANSVALGTGSVASSGSLGVKGFAPDNAALTAGTAFGELSVGTSGKERRITNVAAGYNATDAVNVSQLMAEDVKVNNVSSNLSNLSNVVNNIGANVSMKYFHANSSLVDSTASGANAIAVGPQATAAGTNAIAVGYNASATSAESVALGSNSTTSANLSATAYNPGNATLSGTTAAGEVSVGNGSFNRRITNVAAGYAGTDAVNVSQLMAEDAKVNAGGAATANALGGGSTYNSTTGNISAPTYITGGSTYYNVGGAITNIDARLSNITSGTGDGIKYFHANSTLGDSSASGKDSVAIGGAATATTANSVALGSNSLANSTTLGSAGFAPGGATLSGATAFGEVSVGAQGKERRITNVAAGYAGTDAVNVSQLMAEDVKVNNLSNTVNNIANGGANMKYFNVSSSLAAASATGTDSVAAGPAAVATASNAVALGAKSVADRANTVSVGTSDAQRQIVNVAAGTNSNDAVTVKQLTGVTAALGAGSTVNADGSIKAPAYVLSNQTYTDVGSALTGMVNDMSNLQEGIKYIRFGQTSATTAQASGSDSVAIGGGAFATAPGALAIGTSARASYSNSVAIGYGSAATAPNTFAVGGVALASRRRIVNVADGVIDSDAATVGQMNLLGTNLQAEIDKLNKPQATLLKSAATLGAQMGTSSLTPDRLIVSGPTDKGNSIEATGTDAIAIGLATAADADYAVAVGGNARVASNSAVAIGQNVQAYGVNAVAMGSNAGAMGINAIVIGNNAAGATADDSLAIGNNAQAVTEGAVAIGKDVIASGTNSVALGYASDDGGLTNVVSVGNSKQQRRIINVAAGTQNNDAVNVAQLAGVARALGGGASVNPTTGAVVAPAYTLAGNTYVNVAAALTSLDTRIASGGDPLAVDYDTSTKDLITLKGGATGTKITGLTAGALSASSMDAINGSQLYAQGTSMAKALGGGASINTATGEITAPAYTFGGGTYTNVADALTALNNTAGSGNALGVVYDGQDKSQITLAGATGTKITKVAAGDVNASSTDAMNGSQLYNVAASTADAIGGGSSFDPSTGKITNPTFNIGGSTITNIAGAITNLDDRVYANTTDITNLQTQINEGGIGLVTQDATSRNILVASQTDGSIVDFAGTKGARRLTGVAAGNVNASSFDAVNGTQLYNVAASTASVIGGGSTVKTDGTISNPTYIVGGSTVTTIGGAITNLDARVYANSTDITNLQTQINEGGIGLVTQDATSKNILVASKTDGSIVDFTGKDGARVLTGVAAGTGDFDAVNNAQLKAAGIISADGSTKTAVTYNTVKDDSGKDITDFSNITLGDGTPTSKPVGIHNVADGSAPNDAVNYSQYADLLSKVNSISNAGTGVDTLFVGDGDRNTEQAKAGGTHATAMGALSVANGLQSVATGYASNATGSNAVAIGANSTASGNNSVALGANSVASEDNTVSVGSASQQRRVTNVAAGTATTDAVNVGQLNDAITNASNNTVNQAVQQSNSYTDSQFNKMNDKMNSLGAAAMAATSLIPNARAEGNFQMSAAAGTYGGAAAVAIGANYWVNDRVLVNAHVTRATGNGANTGASAGVTIGF